MKHLRDFAHVSRGAIRACPNSDNNVICLELVGREGVCPTTVEVEGGHVVLVDDLDRNEPVAHVRQLQIEALGSV